ncbi:hypothetical protein ACIGW0_23550 [Streptomyces bikiniensis]|uniref:Uncharacterized protein n=1 Tax=Streptomyces bikiniensis TaxID=1896 RepID=A0ABW8CXL4_STRBI
MAFDDEWAALKSDARDRQSAQMSLRAEGGHVVGGRVVDDGDLVTCGGVTSGIDLGISLIERFFGPDTALFAEEVLEYQRRGIVNTA